MYSIELESFENPYTLRYMRLLWSLSGGELFLVSEADDGSLAGYIAAVPLAGGTCHIASLAVKRVCRRRYVASCLLSSLFEICSSKGYDSYVLEVSYTNKPALRLYTRHGFKVVGVKPDYYGPGNHALVMVRIDSSIWQRI